MNWTVRHQGSPRSIGGLTATAVVAGLADGRWEPSDEVRAGSESRWVALEAHPEFAAIAGDIEPPPRVEPEDESRLDMNPLIDVSLVLLIFFILTTTYETIRKTLDMPGATQSKASAGVNSNRVKDFTIRINVRSEGGKPVIRVEDKVTKPEELTYQLGQFVRATSKRQILLDAQGVEWGVVVQIMDAARAAGIEKTLMLNRPSATP